MDGETVQGPILVLTWNWPNAKSKADNPTVPLNENYVSVKFKTEDDETSINEISPSITIKGKEFADAAKPGAKSKFKVTVEGYVADKGESYACGDSQTFNSDGDGSVELENVQFEVGSGLGDTFADGTDCNDSGDNTVAIAVGVTVAVLICVVVGGFLFKRYKDKKRYA